jgi:biopolymer transport protein ExbD
LKFAKARLHTDRHVLVRADGSVPFALVQDLLTASRDAGYTEVSLVTFRGTRLEAWEKGGAV